MIFKSTSIVWKQKENVKFKIVPNDDIQNNVNIENAIDERMVPSQNNLDNAAKLISQSSNQPTDNSSNLKQVIQKVDNVTLQSQNESNVVAADNKNDLPLVDGVPFSRSNLRNDDKDNNVITHEEQIDNNKDKILQNNTNLFANNSAESSYTQNSIQNTNELNSNVKTVEKPTNNINSNIQNINNAASSNFVQDVQDINNKKQVINQVAQQTNNQNLSTVNSIPTNANNQNLQNNFQQQSNVQINNTLLNRWQNHPYKLRQKKADIFIQMDARVDYIDALNKYLLSLGIDVKPYDDNVCYLPTDLLLLDESSKVYQGNVYYLQTGKRNIFNILKTELKDKIK